MQKASGVSIAVTHFKFLGKSDDDGITTYENCNNILFIIFGSIFTCSWDIQQEIHSSVHIQNTNNNEEVHSLLLHLECVIPNDN